MKKSLPIILLFSFLTSTLQGQDFKKLVLTVKTSVFKQGAIYVEPIDNDHCLVVTYLKGSLEANGFKVVSDRKDATYLFTIRYHHRADTGCGGYVMKDMDGTIMDIKNNAETVAAFSFSQGGFEGKCASDVLSALAKKISAQAK